MSKFIVLRALFLASVVLSSSLSLSSSTALAHHAVPGMTCSNDPAQTDGVPHDSDPAHHRPRCTPSPTEPTPPPTPPLVIPETPTPSTPATPTPPAQPETPPAPKNTFFRFSHPALEAQIMNWKSSYPDGARALERIVREPQARWLVDGNIDTTATAVHNALWAAKNEGSIPVFVTYNIPNRDCGSYSAGGSDNGSNYLRWIRGIARELGDTDSIIILEPDALTFNECLGDQGKEDRYTLVRDAVSILMARPNTKVYLDAGHPEWIPVNEMADRLKKAGIEKATGFAINVSNFYSNESNANYGSEVSRLVGNRHFVIDTSRNGAYYEGSYGWCNPSGRKLGAAPTTNTGNALIDAFLWIKNPGESDGTCNGGPNAGAWWTDYALRLAQ